MTGQKEGLTGHFMRENSHLVNTHCAAHGLALVGLFCTYGAQGRKMALRFFGEAPLALGKKFPGKSLNQTNTNGICAMLRVETTNGFCFVD